jgi:hypothetical protein
MPDALYPELKITVQNDGTVVVGVPGEQSARDGKISRDELLRETLTTFRDWINQGKLTINSERELALLGRLLHRLLFGESGPKIMKLMYGKLSEAQESHRRMCVQLAFEDEQAELASLPWEFLYDDQSSSFFATTNDLTLTRFIDGMKARQALLPNELPLRMLIVVSKKGGRTVAAQDVIKAITEFAGQHPERIKLDEPLIDPSLLRMQEYLEVEANRPHIIHFIGHGRYNKTKRQGEIALARADESDEADWVDQARFKNMFTNAGCIPKLVFLQLCEGAVVEGGELIASFEGLAPALIGANVQAVVAMQFPIKNVHAGRISTKFYDELTKHKSVGEAVQAARRIVSLVDPVAGGTPVLYMYGYDGAIVSKADAQPARSAAELRIGTSASEPAPPTRPEEPAVTQTLRAAVPALPATPLAPDGSSAVLSKLMVIGSEQIVALVPGAQVQGIQIQETPKDAILLRRRLHSEVIPALRGKTVLDMRQKLADLCEGEGGTPFGQVLKAMFDALLGMP